MGAFVIREARQGLVAPTLQALLPLRHLLQGVTNLSLNVAEMPNDESLDLLSSLFGSLTSLTLSGIPPDRMQDVSCMKFLEKWGSLKTLVLHVFKAPSDCLLTLRAAGLQHRSFVLKIVTR